MMCRKNAHVLGVEANPFSIMFSAVYFMAVFILPYRGILEDTILLQPNGFWFVLFAFGQKNQNFVLIHFTILLFLV